MGVTDRQYTLSTHQNSDNKGNSKGPIQNRKNRTRWPNSLVLRINAWARVWWFMSIISALLGGRGKRIAWAQEFKSSLRKMRPRLYRNKASTVEDLILTLSTFSLSPTISDGKEVFPAHQAVAYPFSSTRLFVSISYGCCKK